MDWIAEGLSSVGFFLEPCVHGREPHEQAHRPLLPALQATASIRSIPTCAPTTSPIKLDAGKMLRIKRRARGRRRAPDVDAELLAIFLEEADEVLQTIEATLPIAASKPDDREALTTIRRGFHTLKGSGRMVGLMDLGEVAWEIEQVMNRWLEQKRRATPALLDLLGRGMRGVLRLDRASCARARCRARSRPRSWCASRGS